MSKKRRLFTPSKNKLKYHKYKSEILKKEDDNDVWSARGRLKGALMDVLDNAQYDSDASSKNEPLKRDRATNSEGSLKNDSDEEGEKTNRFPSPTRHSYVLKLFDRSVNLSQFREDSPLYPICRAWIANQPKATYKTVSKDEPVTKSEDSVELPGPKGPPVTRIPELLPEQKACSKDNINLNYKEAPPPPLEQLISMHAARWANVRNAWLRQAAHVEARYTESQQILNEISTT